MRRTSIGMLGLLLLGMLAALVACDPDESEPRVLLIFSYHEEHPWHVDEARGSEEILEREGIEYEAFYLDTKRHTDDAWKAQAAAAARQRIEDYKPSLIIVFDDNACALVASEYAGESLPFVFCGVNADPAEYGYPAPNLAGVLERPDLRASAELLLKLVPDVESLALILDASPSAEGFAKGLEDVALPVQVVDVHLTNDFADWQAEVLKVQQEANAIGLFTYHTIRRTGEDESMSPDEILNWTLANSTLPELATLDFTVEGGALCGAVLSGQEQGSIAAEMAVRILNGEEPTDIPLAIPQATRSIVNASRAAQLGIEIDQETLDEIELIE